MISRICCCCSKAGGRRGGGTVVECEANDKSPGGSADRFMDGD